MPQCGASFCRWLLSDAATFANGDPERPLRTLKGKALPALPESYAILSVGLAAPSLDQGKRHLTATERARIEQNKKAALKRKRAAASGLNATLPLKSEAPRAVSGPDEDPWEADPWAEHGFNDEQETTSEHVGIASVDYF